jgi:hypothetical protein
MRCGEYSHLLWQIRRRKAEHLAEDCWRVTLPNGKTLPVLGNRWKLITILPKNRQPPPRPLFTRLAACPLPAPALSLQPRRSSRRTSPASRLSHNLAGRPPRHRVVATAVSPPLARRCR